MCLYELLEMVQNGGLRMLDQHIEQPEESTIFPEIPAGVNPEAAGDLYC